jgi:hypothetical protein
VSGTENTTSGISPVSISNGGGDGRDAVQGDTTRRNLPIGRTHEIYRCTGCGCVIREVGSLKPPSRWNPDWGVYIVAIFCRCSVITIDIDWLVTPVVVLHEYQIGDRVTYRGEDYRVEYVYSNEYLLLENADGWTKPVHQESVRPTLDTRAPKPQKD